MTTAALASCLPKRSWRTISWREGTNTALTSRFARIRVRAGGESTTGDEPEEWLIVEWPIDENEPTETDALGLSCLTFINDELVWMPNSGRQTAMACPAIAS